MAAAAHVPVVEWCNHPLDVPVTTLSLFIRFYPWQTRAVVLRPPQAAAGCGSLRTVVDAMTPCCVIDEPHCICGIAPEEVARAARMLLGETRPTGV